MKNKFLMLAVLLFALMAFRNGGKKPVAPINTADNAGWVTLFDGKTLNGWHSYGKATANDRWQVIDGAITVDPSKKGSASDDLCTADEYDNFDLKLEWKIAPKGNSGIIFYVNEKPDVYDDTYNTGMEMQVLDNDGNEDGKNIKHRAGDLYDLISCKKETVKPVGEWNDVEIKSNNGKLDLYLNGTNVVSTNLWDDNWKKMIAGSKFKNMTGFGTFKKGRIALQDHGFMVSYRNIKIKKL